MRPLTPTVLAFAALVFAAGASRAEPGEEQAAAGHDRDTGAAPREAEQERDFVAELLGPAMAMRTLEDAPPETKARPARGDRRSRRAPVAAETPAAFEKPPVDAALIFH